MGPPEATRRLLYALLLVTGCDPAPKRQAAGDANAPASDNRPPAPAPASATSRPELLTLDVETPPPPAPAAPTSVTAQGRRPYAVAVLGDSLSDPKVGGGGYLAYVQERCPKTRIDNFAKGGWMVNQMRRRFEEEVLKESLPGSYSHLVVFGGVNDLYSDLTAGRTPAKIEADLSRIYEKAHEHGMKVVALTVAPWGRFTRYFNATRSEATRTVNKWISAELGAKGNDVVVDSYSLLSCGEPEMLCPEYLPPFKDGLHFGKLGQQKLGQALYEAAFKDCE